MLSALSSIGCLKKGPSSFAVKAMAAPAASVTESVAPGGPESQRSPDQRGKDEVGDRLVGGDGEHAQSHHGQDEEPALPGAHAPEGAAGVASPGEDERERDQPARRVAQPPCAAERDGLRPVDDAAREHGDRSTDGADRGGCHERDEHADDLIRPVERGIGPDQPPQQDRADDDLEHVAGLLADDAPERQGVLAREELGVDAISAMKTPGQSRKPQR